MPDDAPTWFTLLGIGIACAGCLALGAVIGLAVDSLLHTSPIFVMAGLGVGVVGAVVYTITQFRKLLR